MLIFAKVVHMVINHVDGYKCCDHFVHLRLFYMLKYELQMLWLRIWVVSSVVAFVASVAIWKRHVFGVLHCTHGLSLGHVSSYVQVFGEQRTNMSCTTWEQMRQLYGSILITSLMYGILSITNLCVLLDVTGKKVMAQTQTRSRMAKLLGLALEPR